MARNAESMIVRADMSAFEFHEAAWEANQEGTTQPDPATLSDRTLYVVMRYEERDLPSDSVRALEAEYRRRGLVPDVIERVLGLGLLAILAISGFVIGWTLFAR
jgi:hypothetical protein